MNEAKFINVLKVGWQRGLVKGWEPPEIRSPPIMWAVENGYLRIVDGRCGFELIKDSFVVWTHAGKIAMEKLCSESA